MAEAKPTTVAYKQVGDLTLYVDVYPPTPESDVPVPAVVFFHGGGMTSGDRTSWFPTWLLSESFPPSLASARAGLLDLTSGSLNSERTTAAGLAFLSADYRLLAPSTGHDVLDDVVDLFAFLARTQTLGAVQIDSTRLAVAGASAGGMCAFLAAVHAKPKPCAVLSIYGLGGDVFVRSSSLHTIHPHANPETNTLKNSRRTFSPPR
jgi:acetyl esterase/lipase